MSYTLKELAQTLGASYVGDDELVISHVCGLNNPSKGGLSYLTNDKNIANVPTSAMLSSEIAKGLSGMDRNMAVIVKPGIESSEHNLIYSEDPLSLHVEATNLLHPRPNVPMNVHETAVIGKNVTIGEAVSIGPHCVLYDGVTIGEGTVLHAGVTVMNDSIIGEKCLIYPHVVVREDCIIQDRVVIHSNAVIGSDGHGYYQRQGVNKKLPQVGGVRIGSDVEIGSCTTVDRGRLEPTVVGDGVKLDNQVQIGHNVDLGDHALISAQSAIGGSTKIGHHLILGGQAGIVDHIEVGNHVSAIARTAITSSTKDNKILAGMPSRPVRDWRMIEAHLNRLEGLFKRVKKLEEADGKSG